MRLPIPRSRAALSALLATGLLLGCTQGGSLSPAERDEAEMAVSQLARGWETAWNGGDIPSLVTHYTDDAIIVNARGEDASGIDGVQQYLQGLFANGVTYTGASIATNEIAVFGDHAFTNGTASATMTTPGMESVAMEWKYMNLLQRQDDGTWKIRKSMAVQTKPPLVPAPDSTMMSKGTKR